MDFPESQDALNRSRMLKLAERMRSAELQEQLNASMQVEAANDKLQAFEQRVVEWEHNVEGDLARLQHSLKDVGAALYEDELKAQESKERNVQHIRELEDIGSAWIVEQTTEERESLVVRKDQISNRITGIEEHFRQEIRTSQQNMAHQLRRVHRQADELLRKICESTASDTNTRIVQTVSPQLDRFAEIISQERQHRQSDFESLRVSIEQTRTKLLTGISEERRQQKEFQKNTWSLLERACDRLQSKLSL